MRVLVAVLATVVALQYAVIALYVVPRLARIAVSQGLAVHLARWGAAAFFAGCALTHVTIAVAALRHDAGATANLVHDSAGHGLTSGSWTLLRDHVLPHVAQVIGGALFIGVVHRRLALTIMTKSEAGDLRELQLHLRSVFERAPVGVVLLGVDSDKRQLGSVLQVNPALCRLVGHDEQTLRAADYAELVVHPDDRAAVQRALSQLLDGEERVELEQRYLHHDGHEIWVQVQASLTHDEAGAARHCVMQVRDVTDDRSRESQLRHHAEHDSLTGLLNRRRFREELDRAIATTQRYGEPAGLLVVDLDHFKFVNDTYGHATGDRLLRAVAGVLRSRLRDTDILGRLGGDEFGVLLPRQDEAGATTLAQALLAALQEHAHVTVHDRSVRTGASIGVTMISRGETSDADQLLARADIAMYEAKETGRDRVARADGAEHGTGQMRARLTWSERVRDALADDGLVLWEQPILNLVTGRVDRSELLLRMRDPQDGSLIPPGAFLAAAERFGQIQAIDRWVFSEAIRLLEIRQAAGDLRSLEINLSGVSLTDARLIDDIVAQLAKASFDPGRLIVEVTETAAVTSVELAQAHIARLSAAGCPIALDDFGSGFGSFFYLKHFPFDGVKIDGDFIKDLPASHGDLLTLDAIVTIAQGMGKEVTAEYVQNAQTVALLRERGVGFAQGYHIGKPRPVPELASSMTVSLLGADREPAASPLR